MTRSTPSQRRLSLSLSLLPLLILVRGAFIFTFHTRRTSRPPQSVARISRQSSIPSAPSQGTFGVQQSDGEPVSPAAFGAVGQTAEAIETSLRSDGNGPRTRTSNSIIRAEASSREGGVLVSDFATAGKDGGKVCDAQEGEVCEMAPDRFSRAGFVMRNSTDEQAGVDRRALSLETTHTCMCLDKACRHIAEVRAVAVFKDGGALKNKTPREHACLVRKKTASALFTGCAQSLLVGRRSDAEETWKDIKSGKLFPDHVAAWTFEFDRPPLRWSAHGRRGYFSVMMADEFDELQSVDLEADGLEVDFAVLEESLEEKETTVYKFLNATAGASCAETMNWVLHAAAHQATALDDAGRGVFDGTFVDPLPPRASTTELALSIGQALLGLATLYLLLGDVLLETFKLKDRAGRNGRRKESSIERAKRLVAMVCQWPVVLAWLFGLFLLALEMCSIAIVWLAEKNAISTLGKFVKASFVAGVAQDTGPLPSLIDESGNVVVVTLIVGTAKYTKSNEFLLRILFPLCIALGVAALVLALVPVQIWRTFSAREIGKQLKDVTSFSDKVGREIVNAPHKGNRCEVRKSDVAKPEVSVAQPFRVASYK